jgi:hypothetical protein
MVESGRISLATEMAFSDGATLELATMTGSVASGFTTTLTVAVQLKRLTNKLPKQPEPNSFHRGDAEDPKESRRQEPIWIVVEPASSLFLPPRLRGDAVDFVGLLV